MKFTQSFGNRVVTFIALAAAFMVVNYSDAQVRQGNARVRFVEGSAQYSSGGGAFVPLQAGTVLHSGDVIRTGPNSHVDLFLGKNNGVIQVTPNSTLALTTLTFNDTGAETVADTQLDVQAGAILGQAGRVSAASKYEIRTPRGVAGIRGTKYRVTAAGEVTVAEGVVYVTYMTPTGPQTFTVRAGETITPGAAGPTKAPEDLIRMILEAIDGIQKPPGAGEVIVVVRTVAIEPFISPTVGATFGDSDGFDDFPDDFDDFIE